ncbi:hypothetical protein [Legionella sp. W05-934-2]|jgi:hypothetical protein|uniref:hypothetical protein n=1 Tax=Legionella sp. W05-934-2 TaxID=1198649 RepID=UPI0034630EDD
MKGKYKTTTVGMDNVQLMPDKDALLKMLDTISTPEAAYFAQVRVAKRLGNLEAALPVIKKFVDFASSVSEVSRRQTSGREWNGGSEPLTDFKSLQEFLADKSLDNIKALFKQAGLLDENGELKGELELDFAVNEKSQFVRGYKLNGKPLDNKTLVEELDNVFKARLAEKGIFYKNGQLYEVDDKGKIKQNDKGEEMLMNREEIFKRVQDVKDGFGAFMKSKGLQTNVVRRAFPSGPPVSEADRKQMVEDSLKKGIKTEGMADEEGVDVHPDETPSGPASTSGG